MLVSKHKNILKYIYLNFCKGFLNILFGNNSTMGAINNLIKVIIGLILVIVAVWFAINFSDWGKALIDIIQGGIVLAVILIGLVLIMLGFSDLK